MQITLKTCTSTQKLYSASRTSVLTYGVLLVALILCVIPEAVFVTTLSSGICGPIEAKQSMYNVVAHYIGVRIYFAIKFVIFCATQEYNQIILNSISWIQYHSLTFDYNLQ